MNRSEISETLIAKRKEMGVSVEELANRIYKILKERYTVTDTDELYRWAKKYYREKGCNYDDLMDQQCEQFKFRREAALHAVAQLDIKNAECIWPGVSSMESVMNYIEALGLKLILKVQEQQKKPELMWFEKYIGLKQILEAPDCPKLQIFEDYRHFAAWVGRRWPYHYCFNPKGDNYIYYSDRKIGDYWGNYDYKNIEKDDKIETVGTSNFYVGQKEIQKAKSFGFIPVYEFLQFLDSRQCEMLIVSDESISENGRLIQINKDIQEIEKEKRVKGTAYFYTYLFGVPIIIAAFFLWLYWTWQLFSSPSVLESDTWFGVGCFFSAISLNAGTGLFFMFLLNGIVALIPIASITVFILCTMYNLFYKYFDSNYDKYVKNE